VPAVDTLALLAQAAGMKIDREGLHGFAAVFWKDAGEAEEFKDNWHLWALANVLEQHAQFAMGDTVINVPPSTGKTLWTQVFWPAWLWGTLDAGRRFIFTSYDRDKIHQTARQFLRLVRSPLYQAMFPKVRLSRTNTAEAEIENTEGGVRLAYQMGGGVTSKHAHHVVCDDPDKAGETSPDQFTKTLELWRKTFSTRRADPTRHTNILVMQRLNHDDLAGEMLRPPHNYEHVCFPMRYVPNCPWDHGCSLGRLDIRTEPGELLWADRYTPEALAKIEIALETLQNVSAQMQQNPVPETGSYFEDSWFRTWDVLPAVRAMHIVQSWDLGFKGRGGKGTADSWVHGALWAQWEKRYMLLDEVHIHANYPETKRAFVAAQARSLWSAAGEILIEDKANGTALIAELRELPDVRISIRAVEPHGSKEERAKRHSAKAEDGRLWLPPAHVAPWVAEFRAELVRFPNQKANDRVDTTTQALDRLGVGGAYSKDLWQKILENM
jgi:predicted phage terminase large subunit-like protein